MATTTEKIDAILNGTATVDTYLPIKDSIAPLVAMVPPIEFPLYEPSMVVYLTDGTEYPTDRTVTGTVAYDATTKYLDAVDITISPSTTITDTTDGTVVQDVIGRIDGTATYHDETTQQEIDGTMVDVITSVIDATIVLRHQVDGTTWYVGLAHQDWVDHLDACLGSISDFDALKSSLIAALSSLSSGYTDRFAAYWTEGDMDYTMRVPLMDSASGMKKRICEEDGIDPPEDDATFVYVGTYTLTDDYVQGEVQRWNDASAFLASLEGMQLWLPEQTVLVSGDLQQILSDASAALTEFIVLCGLETDAYDNALAYIKAYGAVAGAANASATGAAATGAIAPILVT